MGCRRGSPGVGDHLLLNHMLELGNGFRGDQKGPGLQAFVPGEETLDHDLEKIHV